MKASASDFEDAGPPLTAYFDQRSETTFKKVVKALQSPVALFLFAKH